MKQHRGFSAMSPEQRRVIASKGGKVAHALGTAHEWTSEEAREAGHRGGAVTARRKARKEPPTVIEPEAS